MIRAGLYSDCASAKGLHELVVIVKHAVRNGTIPILTLPGGTAASVLVSAARSLIEVILASQGMGLHFFDATLTTRLQRGHGRRWSLEVLLGPYLAF